MSKEDQKILVVEKDLIFNNGKYFQGFKFSKDFDYETLILGNMKVMRRGDAEQDVSHKQPIGYMMIINSTTKKVYAYQRALKDEHYSEKRLQGKWSWGVGGHIEPMDLEKGNPIIESRLRELSEEIEIEGRIGVPQILGYINDDRDSVGKVHLGLLYLIEIDGNAKPKDKETIRGEMLTIQELEEICASPKCKVEGWSEIALGPLKNILLKNVI